MKIANRLFCLVLFFGILFPNTLRADEYSGFMEEPSWIRAAPHANKEKQVGHNDPVARDDVINRPAKALWVIAQQLVDGAIGQNLLKAGSFESWSAGTSDDPDGWALVGTGAAVERTTDEKWGDYAAQVSYGGADAYLKQNYLDYDYFQGGKVTLGAWVKTSTASIARLKINDGVGNSASDYHTGGGAWELLKVTRTVDGSASALWSELHVEGTGIAYFDAVKLEEGEIATAFNQHPNDQHLKAIHYQDSTPTNFVYGQFRVEFGKVTKAISGASTGDKAITFQSAFSVLKGAWATSDESPSGSWVVEVGGFSPSGMTVYWTESSATSKTTTLTAYWIAIGVN